jgi:hydrogenase expression/formation protein HypE
MSGGFALSCPVPFTATDTIEIGHGGGGMMTRRLVEGLFRPAFGAGEDELVHDGALLDAGGAGLAFTTDSYVVRPLFFPGGDIGTLAVNGTVNDLAMCGAEPLALSVGLILEEGLAISQLRRIVESMRAAADAAGARIVTGDTKVVEHGKGDGIYINTSGVGRVIAPAPVGPRQVAAGDVVIVSGDVGRHGIAIMAVREGLGFETEIASDCAPLIGPVRALITAGVPLHCLRDLTRGGLATALIEIAETAGFALQLDQQAIPVSDAVRGACEILGLDPLYVANEGRFVAFVPASAGALALGILRRFDPAAAIIGRVGAARQPGVVNLDTLGGLRPLDLLSGEQLPRIC